MINACTVLVGKPARKRPLERPMGEWENIEDNTTRYWREQQARGKLQIAEETEQWANKYKNKLLQQTLGNTDTVRNKWTTPIVR
jgi:hypothetical protein